MGPLATINREPGQAWKGAATAVDLCAGVWLVQVATYYQLARNSLQYFNFDEYLDTEITHFELQW